ncbi:unnamed protein product [Gordionus sp. m RMFG-2023]
MEKKRNRKKKGTALLCFKEKGRNRKRISDRGKGREGGGKLCLALHKGGDMKGESPTLFYKGKSSALLRFEEKVKDLPCSA